MSGAVLHAGDDAEVLHQAQDVGVVDLMVDIVPVDLGSVRSRLDQLLDEVQLRSMLRSEL